MKKAESIAKSQGLNGVNAEFIAMAINLQQEFRQLLESCASKVNTYSDDYLVGMRLVVKSLLTEVPYTAAAELNKYRESIKSCHTFESLFDFLIENKFIGYLNPVILFDLVAPLQDEILQQKVKQYKESYLNFISQQNFAQLIDVFTSHESDLQPSSIVGLPTLVVYLSEEWHNHSMDDLLQNYLQFVEECKLHLDSLCFNCVMITYSVFPQYLEKLMLILKNFEFLAKCENAGITFELSGIEGMLCNCYEFALITSKYK